METISTEMMFFRDDEGKTPSQNAWIAPKSPKLAVP